MMLEQINIFLWSLKEESVFVRKEKFHKDDNIWNGPDLDRQEWR